MTGVKFVAGLLAFGGFSFLTAMAAGKTPVKSAPQPSHVRLVRRPYDWARDGEAS